MKKIILVSSAPDSSKTQPPASLLRPQQMPKSLFCQFSSMLINYLCSSCKLISLIYIVVFSVAQRSRPTCSSCPPSSYWPFYFTQLVKRTWFCPKSNPSSRRYGRYSICLLSAYYSAHKCGWPLFQVFHSNQFCFCCVFTVGRSNQFRESVLVQCHAPVDKTNNSWNEIRSFKPAFQIPIVDSLS